MRSRSLLVMVLAVLAACSAGYLSKGAPSISPPATSITPPAASYARALPATPAAADVAGSISGRLGAPCECLPAQSVYAISVDGKRYYSVDTVTWQDRYTLLGVAAGDYFVASSVRAFEHSGAATAARTEPATRFASAYTKAVPCGLSVDCPDHALIAVHVAPGQKTSGIDPADWYAQPDDYPLIPSNRPAAPTLPAPPATFSAEQDAAVSLGQVSTLGRYVTAEAQCPLNVACFWFTSSREGHAAAYYAGASGSNHDLVPCGFYLVDSDAGWRTFESRCVPPNTTVLAVGATARVTLGLGETGCVNVHASPALTAKTMACLQNGTAVSIDDGPYYSGASSVSAAGAQISATDYWWHVAGQGWMVHQYLR